MNNNTIYFFKNGKTASISYLGEGYYFDDNMVPISAPNKIVYNNGNGYKYFYDENGNLKKKELEHVYQSNYFPKLETYATYREDITYGIYLANPLKVAITSKIKKIKFDGIDCYEIVVKDENSKEKVLWFEKETGLLRRKDEIKYFYTFNAVNDRVFEMPDAEEAEQIVYQFNISKEEID